MEIINSVKEIMEMCDLITVSTEFLGEVYQKAFNIPKEKFCLHFSLKLLLR